LESLHFKVNNKHKINNNWNTFIFLFFNYNFFMFFRYFQNN
jgi:hypothetical protein